MNTIELKFNEKLLNTLKSRVDCSLYSSTEID